MEQLVELRPRRRTAGLVVKELDGETLIYDLNSHRAHRLNLACGTVWHACDGATSLPELAERVHAAAGLPLDESLVHLALQELEKAGLLQEVGRPAPALPRISRREATRRLALAGGLSLLVPAVTSIVAPTAAEAGSCLPPGAACSTSAECCSQVCAGVCA
jgi:hypothetical protein